MTAVIGVPGDANTVASSGKDAKLKLWDLQSQGTLSSSGTNCLSTAKLQGPVSAMHSLQVTKGVA